MKYLSEYRDPSMVKKYLADIHAAVSQEWTIMEICGGQTHSLVKNGLLSILPPQIKMVHGPGCPVCVTPMELIDKAVYLVENGVTLCSFGDMLRVPGSKKSLLEAKSEGGDVKIVYSPLEAVKFAKNNPDKEVVFFAVGFETTAPANALSVMHAHRAKLNNYSILASHVLVPPAMEAILGAEDNQVQGFLAAGHVCAIMGLEEYVPLAEKYQTPIVVTGFEPLDLLQGILMTVKQLEEGRWQLENQYTRAVKAKGNQEAQVVVEAVFEVSDRAWRGLGIIPNSGYQVRKEYQDYDANLKYQVQSPEVCENPDCIAGQILKGLKKPHQCSQFAKKCTPEKPLGAPMVSSEGACAAYYHYSGAETLST